jgi:hypothetical protein
MEHTGEIVSVMEKNKTAQRHPQKRIEGREFSIQELAATSSIPMYAIVDLFEADTTLTRR